MLNKMKRKANAGGLASISMAQGMNDSIPTQGQGVPGAASGGRIMALKKMKGKKK